MSFKSKRIPLMLVVGALLSGTLSGCNVTSSHIKRHVDLRLAKLSFLRWNSIGSRPKVCDHTLACSLDLLKLSNDQLDQLIQQGQGPDPETMDGPWLGINKGCAAACVGWIQDIKVFQTSNGCRSGYNVAVHQVPISRLECDGWEPKTKLLSDQPKTLGKFCVLEPKCPCLPLKLDYTQAGNPCYDPSHVLVDDLVLIQENLVLGKASAMIAGKKIGVAYFVLIKPHDDCCDSQ